MCLVHLLAGLSGSTSTSKKKTLYTRESVSSIHSQYLEASDSQGNRAWGISTCPCFDLPHQSVHSRLQGIDFFLHTSLVWPMAHCMGVKGHKSAQRVCICKTAKNKGIQLFLRTFEDTTCACKLLSLKVNNKLQ